MSDHKQQNWFVPLRVRIRPPAESPRWERERLASPLPSKGNDQPLAPQVETIAGEAELLQRTRQTKELLRLCNILRAELGLDEVLQQIVASISACTGFRVLISYLIDEETDTLKAVAFTGISEEGMRVLRDTAMPVEHTRRLMRQEFRISQSYFISHENPDTFPEIVTVVHKTVDNYEPGGWHPEDTLIVPLFSLRKKKLLGFLSLDNPEDGKIPTVESIEVAELFANQAAIAIDNARLFQERENERLALEEAITQLRADLEQIQHGDLRVRVHSTHGKLQPIGDAINMMVEEISAILGNVQMVTQAVDNQTHEIQHSSEILARDANQHERQIQHISHVIDEIAVAMHQVSERAGELSRVAVEAMDATTDGQGTVDRARDGMGQVRETTMQSARIMKRLGESSQEINETILTITNLTTRMHLLALNAAIEAARAGEHGQGFAVIAQEIRSLAVHSSEAARKVANHIRNIQHETTAVARSIEQNTQQVVKQTELVMQSGAALEAISIITDQMVSLVRPPG